MRDKKNEFIQLSYVEQEIMMIVWNAKTEKITSIYIRNNFSREWAIQPITTVLNRLIKKGYIQCEKDIDINRNVYTAIITKDEYKKSVSKSFLEKIFGNSLSDLLTSLYNCNCISQKDIDELQSFINNTKNLEE